MRYGSLDLGGVSSEIAYKDYSPPSNYSFSFSITRTIPFHFIYTLIYPAVNTSMYQVYAQGIDGLGVNSARYTLNYTLFTNTTGSILLHLLLHFLCIFVIIFSKSYKFENSSSTNVRYCSESLCAFWI